MSQILQTLKELVTSKKFLVGVAGIIIAFAAKHGLNLDPATTQYIVGIVIAYIVGQAITDHGVVAAKVNAVSRQVELDTNNTLPVDKVDIIKNV